MQILNIAGYKFISLTDLASLQKQFLHACNRLELKGTILLSHEGININLCGTAAKIDGFKQVLVEDTRFADLTFRESFSTFYPFDHMRVKLKPEIITMRQNNLQMHENKAPSISPQELKQLLDDNQEISLLDTRNDYEVRFGTFKNSINLKMDDFCQFPAVTDSIPRNNKIVMFCTGGIRCEKAANYLLNSGFAEVYQLEGGILNYFKEVGRDHYEGECFVFDKRISLNSKLEVTGTEQCVKCEGPIRDTKCLSCVN